MRAIRKYTHTVCVELIEIHARDEAQLTVRDDNVGGERRKLITIERMKTQC